MRIVFSFIFFQLFCFTLFSHGKVGNDTIYIYEEVVVYDTIYVHDTVKVFQNIPVEQGSLTLLRVDTLNQRADLLYLGQQSATIPINSIILHDNIKNYESMRRLSFFGVLFFAFQSMVMSQTSFEVSLGTGTWFQTGNIKGLNTPFSCTIDAGAYVRQGLFDNLFSLKTGVEYALLFPQGEYVDTYEKGFSRVFLLGELNSTYNLYYHYFSIPLLFSFDKFKVRPFVGVNYNWLTSQRYRSSPSLPKNSVKGGDGFGIIAGVEYTINRSFAIDLSYRHNLANDFSVSINNEESFYMRNNQLKLSLVYTFGRCSKAKE